MIIANYQYGRLGNQLQLAAHLITFASEEQRRVLLLFLNDNAVSFPYFENNSLKSVPPLNLPSKIFITILLKITTKISFLNLISEINFLSKNDWIFFDEDYSKLNDELNFLKKSWIAYVKVWRLRSTSSIIKYKSKIKDIFTPKIEILNHGKSIINSLNCDVVVGVHIRWGDFKTEAPELFYDINIYKKRMIETQNLFIGKSVGFVVCTEELININELNDLNCVFPKSSAINDLYTLAQTQYLIASASTFSEWAAYWGEVDIFRIIDPAQNITSINDFISFDLIPKFQTN